MDSLKDIEKGNMEVVKSSTSNFCGLGIIEKNSQPGCGFCLSLERPLCLKGRARRFESTTETCQPSYGKPGSESWDGQADPLSGSNRAFEDHVQLVAAWLAQVGELRQGLREVGREGQDGAADDEIQGVGAEGA